MVLKSESHNVVEHRLRKTVHGNSGGARNNFVFKGKGNILIQCSEMFYQLLPVS